MPGSRRNANAVPPEVRRPIISQSRVYWQFLCYFLVLLIPAIFTGFFSYAYYNRTQQNDFMQSNAFSIDAAVESIDKSLLGVQEVGLNFCLDNTVRLAFTLPADTNTQFERLKVPQVITRYTGMSPITLDNFFVFMDDQAVYTSAGIDVFDDYLNKFYRLQGYDAQTWARLLGEKRSTFFPSPATRTREGIPGQAGIVPMTMITTINGHKTVLCACVPVQTLLSMLRDGLPSDHTRLVITGADGGSIWTDDPADGENAALFVAGQEGQTSWITGGTMVTRAESAMLGWTIYALTPLRVFQLRAAPLARVLVLQFALMLTLGVLLALYFSYRLYAPLRAVQQMMHGEAGRREPPRSYAGTMYWLAAEHSQQCDLAEQASQRYRSLLLSHLLLDGPEDADASLYRRLADSTSEGQPPLQQCAVLCFTPQQRPIEETLYAVERVLTETMQCLCFAWSDQWIVVAVDWYVPSAGMLEAGMLEALRLFSGRAHAGIGDVRPAPVGFRRSFDAAMTALLYRAERESPISRYAPEAVCPEETPLAFEEEHRIIQGLEEGDVPRMEKVLSQAVCRLEAQRLSYLGWRAFADSVHRLGKRYMMDRHGSVRALPSIGADEIDWLLEGCGVLVCRLNAFLSGIVALNDCLEPEKQASAADEMKAYIQAHYADEMSVGHVAEAVGVSIGHASRVFKKETGMSIGSYISMARMEKACELLSGTQMKIEDVAAAVGINNRTTFMRVFRAEYGVTPGTYRSEHGQRKAIKNPHDF